MVRIQLIEPQKGWLDVAEGTRFPINISASDIRDVGSRSGTYSKTVVLAGTENNNTLLNYYFEVNIQAGTFDINKIQKCVVYQDGEVILDNAVIRLLSVSEILGNIQYEAQVLDTTSDLFTQINDKFLTDIDFTDLNHTYNSTNVSATFNNGNAQGYAYLLPFSNENEYSLQQCKPAIFVKTYLDRMFAKAGKKYTYSDAELLGFSDLILPYNGDTLKISEERLNQLEVKATKAIFEASNTSTGGTSMSGINNITTLTEVKDLDNLYNPTTGVYTSPVDTLPYSGTINYEIKGKLRLKWRNTNGHEVYFVRNNYILFSNQNTVAFDTTLKAEFVWNNNGVVHQAFPIDETTIRSTTGSNGAPSNLYKIPNGTTTVKEVDLNVIAGVKDVGELDDLLQRLRVTLMSVDSAFSFAFYSPTLSEYVSVAIVAELADLEIRVIPTPFALPSGFEMEMNKVIPTNIKQSDLLKSVLKMYNAYLIQTDENTYSIRTRDAYFDIGDTKDWTFKLDLDKERTITFIPELTSKEVLFSYKPDDKDVVNDGYTKATNSIYGQQSFLFSNQYARGKDVQELIFSPTPHSLTSFGAYLPMINGFAPKNNLRILLHNGVEDCQTYTILDTINSGATLSTYPQIIHLNDPTSPTYDINFGICDFYFYNLTYFTPNTLFNRYYLRQMNQINNGKLMSAYFNLSPSDIRNIKLNDKIKVGNTLWNINKVIDYDANSNSVTKVELISVDDGKRVSPQTTPSTPPGSPGGGGTTQTPNSGNNSPSGTFTSGILGKFERTNDEYTNLIYGDNVDVKGRDNYIVGDNITLIGSSNTILADNVFGVTNNSEVLISNSIIQDATVIPAGALMDELGNLLTDENGNILTI